jgi:hypothetical protein
MSLLPVEPVYRLTAQGYEQPWLVEQLWGEQSVGVIGGEPKCGKSTMALDLAVAVASGTPCLRRFAVPRPGRVLLFAAEEPPHIVRQRIEGISHAAGVALEHLDVQVITAPRLRLDLDDDTRRLAHTVAALRPRLLVLDPFVRMHRCDENVSGAVAPLLDYLRQLQRQFQLAVLVVHHARKGANNVRAGQALRGSSEFHAWADSLLYLRRKAERLTLMAEHRAAAGIERLDLRLRCEAPVLALEIIEPRVDSDTPTFLPAPERIVKVLSEATQPMAFGQLHATCRLRKSTLCHTLAELTRCGLVLKTTAGYTISCAMPSPKPPPTGGTPEVPAIPSRLTTGSGGLPEAPMATRDCLDLTPKS